MIYKQKDKTKQNYLFLLIIDMLNILKSLLNLL